MRRNTQGGRSMPSAAIGGILTRKYKSFAKSFGELAEPAKITIIPGLLTREHRVYRVVKVIVPVCVETIASQARGAEKSYVIEIVLRHQVHWPI
jgi:hypothetical protein